MSEPTTSTLLHIGCGDDYRLGFVNLDRGECDADIHHDLEVVPYPLPSDHFTLVIANQTLEHLDVRMWPQIVAELWRISAPNAVWELRSPYAMSDNFATDPTHRMPLTTRSFDYYDSTRPLGALGRIYGFGPSLRVLTAKRIYGDRHGDDVYHRLLVVKPPAPVVVPSRLPDHLYNGEPRFVSRARAVAVRYPISRAAWRAARRAGGSVLAARIAGPGS
ncbi:MAG: hypothetical protein ACLP01_02270 [Solirubrobacteraceae bacterium]